jgi:hypothetical protein
MSPKRWRQYAILTKTTSVTVRRFIHGTRGGLRPVTLFLEFHRLNGAPRPFDSQIPVERLNDAIDALILARDAILTGVRTDQ